MDFYFEDTNNLYKFKLDLKENEIVVYNITLSKQMVMIIDHIKRKNSVFDFQIKYLNLTDRTVDYLIKIV